MEPDGPAVRAAQDRARQRDLVRRGYDAISRAYRDDNGGAGASSAEDVSRYAGWAAGLELRPASADAVVAFYSLIHVPVPDQRALFPRIREWLRPGGYFLAIVGAGRWTGTESYFGADMFWDDADAATCLDWLRAAQLEPRWDRFVPEGTSGHTLVLAQAS